MALFWARGFGICCDCLDRTNWRCAAFGRTDPVLECRAMWLWKFEMAGRYRVVRASSVKNQPKCAASLPILDFGGRGGAPPARPMPGGGRKQGGWELAGSFSSFLWPLGWEEGGP